MMDINRHALEALASMELRSGGSLYPALHSAAASICNSGGHAYPQAVGAVFRVACQACGVRYNSQYMDRALCAAADSGALMSGLKQMSADQDAIKVA